MKTCIEIDKVLLLIKTGQMWLKLSFWDAIKNNEYTRKRKVLVKPQVLFAKLTHHHYSSSFKSPLRGFSKVMNLSWWKIFCRHMGSQGYSWCGCSGCSCTHRFSDRLILHPQIFRKNNIHILDFQSKLTLLSVFQSFSKNLHPQYWNPYQALVHENAL